jgi:hypothetical protein
LAIADDGARIAAVDVQAAGPECRTQVKPNLALARQVADGLGDAVDRESAPRADIDKAGVVDPLVAAFDQEFTARDSRRAGVRVRAVEDERAGAGLGQAPRSAL